jgi:asparagine synthase (glutamine-hydrolysing)
MCGIAGFIDERISATDAPALISRMLENIAHRGPDARSTWIASPVVLGHNRLSILDLSPDGTQPMNYYNAWIVFNGEIYNYLEVKEELKLKGYIFHTGTDTEVILAAYREYGTECVKKFVGMWSLAIWDEVKRELFCSTDRFGIKPFYYISVGLAFYFGSEYKVLKQTPVFSSDLNFKQISRGLQLGWVAYQNETYFSKLNLLPAGSNLLYSAGKIKIWKYWDIDPARVYTGSENDAAIDLRKLLQSSVDIHLRADVEIAICLSGGIDSSSLAALMSTRNPKSNYKSYSIYFDGVGEVDERPFINAVTNRFKNIQPSFYSPSHNEIMERFDKIMYQVDVPPTGSSNFSHYYLIEKIHADGIKVVFDGQGADEYLAGYMHSMYRFNAEALRGFKLGSLFRNITSTYKFQNYSFKESIASLSKSLLSSIMTEEQLYEFEYKKYFPYVSKLDKNESVFNLSKNHRNDRLNDFLYQLLFTSSLPTILHYVDRMTMSHSVESRVPLLDHRLVEFGFSLPSKYKINNGITKKVLRESVKELLPPQIYNRRDKKGFVTPGENIWLRGPLKNLLELDYNRLDFLNTKLVRKVVKEYEHGDNRNSKLIWRIATLNYWLKSL